MPFVQEKIALATVQTQDIFNLYVYEPANGDTIADITASDYFESSRYIGMDGWIGGMIHTTASDGYVLLQVNTDGTTATAISFSSAAVTALQTDVDELISNVRGISIVSMANDNYTMSEAEAICSVLVLTDVASGKTLTWPTTSDNTRPTQQVIVTTFAANWVTLAAQSGGATAFVSPVSLYIVSVPDGLGVFNLEDYFSIETRASNNGTTTLGAGNTNFADSHGGKLLVAADAAPQTLTINTGLLISKLTAKVYCTGAGGMTVTAGAGVTVSGNAVLAAGDSCDIIRDALTETYRCV